MKTPQLLVLTCALAGLSTAAAQPASVLLITSKELKEAWQPFADWKTKLGKRTHIKTVEEISKTYDGKDIQEKIRNCVMKHTQGHQTRWIILGGDSSPGGKGIVPDRDTPHPLVMRYKDIPSDLYYLSTSSWDANNDGTYGDWQTDKTAISYGQSGVSIGRIPVRTAKDVAAYTAKVIAYESNYPSDTFASTMVYTCPEPGAYPKLNTSRKTVGNDWQQGKLQQFFGNKTPFDTTRPGDHDLTPKNWASMINAKSTGKLHMHGHGHLPVWVLEKHSTVSAKTINTLTNKNAYPVITTVSCFTGHYDAPKDPCISESMLRARDSGAIAVISPSREGVPIFADRSDFRKMVTEGKMDGTTRLLTEFWRIGLKNALTLGEAFTAAQQTLVKEAGQHPGYHWVLCELNLLGDPTLDIRATAPRTPILTCTDRINKGKQTLKVKTAPNATVCLSKPNDLYLVQTADANGNASFEIHPNSTGIISVATSGPNLNAVQSTVTVN